MNKLKIIWKNILNMNTKKTEIDFHREKLYCPKCNRRLIGTVSPTNTRITYNCPKHGRITKAILRS